MELGIVKDPGKNKYDEIVREIDEHLAHLHDGEVVMMQFPSMKEANRVRNALLRRDYIVSMRNHYPNGFGLYISGKNDGNV